jgi:hypothetical protein
MNHHGQILLGEKNQDQEQCMNQGLVTYSDDSSQILKEHSECW